MTTINWFIMLGGSLAVILIGILVIMLIGDDK